MSASDDKSAAGNFIREIITEHVSTKRYKNIVTRFPPEPNGYLHIGHAKAICVNFGLAGAFSGRCHLRMDDTNPETEDTEYVESIKNDIAWLGYNWGEHLYFASDYFQKLYQYAITLIQQGDAYVDSLNEEEIRVHRGTVKQAGTPSEFRDRTVTENIDLFQQMRDGKHPDGAHVLRAKIDLSHTNMKMRDPLLYRIRHAVHHRTGNQWCIYPMYDYAHCISDAIEGITHSLCTLEFDNNREIYDWLLEKLGFPSQSRPHQYEFARLALTYTITSKRKLRQLVEEGHVNGWDDPRMPTLAGIRRRGIPPSSLRTFCERIGVSKSNSLNQMSQFEHVLREELNASSPRMMAVLDPIKVIIKNYPEGQTESLNAPLFPEGDTQITRTVPFGREIYIERDDFMINPSKKFFRLAPGREVRLRYGYFITCTQVQTDSNGDLTALVCTYDPDTKGGNAPDGRKVKATLHWVHADSSINGEVRLYDRLFSVDQPGANDTNLLDQLNPASLTRVTQAKLEPALARLSAQTRVQFERKGYFFTDPIDHSQSAPVFNRIISLKDTWKRIKTGGVATPIAPKIKKKRIMKRVLDANEVREGKSAKLAERFDAYLALGLNVETAHLITGSEHLCSVFDDARAVHDNASSLSNWMTNEVMAVLKSRLITDLNMDGANLGRLVKMVDDAHISSRTAKQVFSQIIETGEDPVMVVKRDGLQQISDPNVLGVIVDTVLTDHQTVVDDYKSGNTRRRGMLIGLVMKASKGLANPQVLDKVLNDKLS